ncbi:MAG: TldD/PmbA family protein [Cetobacterium sp.]|uniref:TldD/PmbA family protein n=1 Tax=Cetobacterium sp. TaxID=2071632 RepID=UPI002FC6BFE1
MTNKKFIDEVFKKANELKLEDFEIFFVSSESSSLKVFKGAVDSYSDNQNGGISFRTKVGDKMGYSYTESLELEDITPLIENAISNGKIIESDDLIEIYGEQSTYTPVKSYSNAIENIDVQDRINFLVEAEKIAFSLDSRVKNVNYCLFGMGTSECIIKNSKGLDLSQKSNSAYVYLAVVVEENGIIKNDSAYIVSKDFKDFDATKLAKEAVSKAISKLNSIDATSHSGKVIINNEAFSDLLEAMSGIFSAENVQKGVSKLKNKLNTQISSEIITLVDDPHLEDGYNSSSFDSEGVPTKCKTIIENGILQTYLHNTKTATKDGIKSTGNASKNGYKGTLGISPFNFYIKNGTLTESELYNKLKNGVLITNFSGLHSGLNSISGDFSLAAEGFLIENGQISKPLNQITLSGNFFTLLEDIEEIGSDLKFNLSGVGSPAVLVKNLNISA